MRQRHILLLVALCALCLNPAGTQPQARQQRPGRPARERAVDPSEIYARILQREDTRWIGSDGFLQDMVRSRNTAVKMRVLLALGRIGDPAALPWLFEQFSSASPLVRARALLAAGQIVAASNLRHEGTLLRPEWLPPMAALISDRDPRVRLRAIEALGKSADKSYAPRVTTAILRASEAPATIGHGLTALVRMEDPSALDRLLVLRSHTSPEVRRRLAWAVYRLRNARAAAQLGSLLSDSSAPVRTQASLAYGLTGAAAVTALASLLQDPNLEVRVAAGRALGATGSASAAPPLVNFIQLHLGAQAGEEEHAVIAAVESWGGLKAAAGAEIVSRLAAELRPAAAAAIVALAKARKGDGAFPSGIEVASAPFWLQRARVAALGENGSHAALQKLLAVSTRSGPEARLLLPWCLDAMIQTGQPIQPEAFWRFLADPDPWLRAHAIQALAELSRRAAGRQSWSAEATEQIMQSYFQYQTEATADARLAAVDFMATLDRADAIPRLERIARDGDRNVRLRARNLLQSRFGRTAPGISGMVNSGRNYAFYANVTRTVNQYWGARFITDRGTWTVRFFSADAPLTVYNFISLVQKGLLNNLTFPRVVPDFVLQGGDPRNDTDGGPGYSIRCEINEQPFLRGTVGMALSGKDSGGSQYFICHSPQPLLDGEYTAFAQVSDGMEAAGRILLGDKVQRIELIDRALSGSATPVKERK